MRAIGRAACAVLAAAACGCTGPFAGTGTDAVNRLVFVDLEGRVVTAASDGSEPTVVSADGEAGFQPVWSPDGGHVAYVAQGGGVSVADLDTGSLQQVTTDVQPFYLHWSPGGERIAALRNSAEGIALELVEVASDGLDTEVVDTGQPYYFSWQPDGDRLVVHVGADRLDLLDPSGETEELGVPPGTFQAPHWAEPGIVATTSGDGGDELVLVGEDGDVEVLAEHSGLVTFAVDPTGRRVAVQSLGPGQGSADDDGGITTTALGAGGAADELAANRLSVVDLDSGEMGTVTAEPAVAYFWSPDGERLLVLELASPRELQWSVWSDGDLADGPSFAPPASWVRTFLPFYDQYARSMTLWSPDGSAFAFPGRVGGDEGIWVHEVADGTTSKVADGTWVAWSHQ